MVTIKALSLPQQAHAILVEYLHKGDVVIDATCGNGHDSLFLAQHVAPEGLVYCFDIQAAAISATHQRLETANLRNCALLMQHSHAQMLGHLAPEHYGKIKAVMFNLGYLPHGDKAIITESNSTLCALNAAVELLAPTGIITILAYPGHSGGDKETMAVENWCWQRSTENFLLQIFNSPIPKANAPRLFVIQKSQ